MERIKGIGSACLKLLRRTCLTASLALAAWMLAVAGAAVVVANSAGGGGGEAARVVAHPADAPGGGWGSEALHAAGEQAFSMSPLAAANACGLGASSCFKCHNGSRAPAPKSDKKAHPWHPDHKTVNDSCVGCHGGNARIIKKEIAHGSLVKDPRGSIGACTTCHKSGNAPALLKTYQASSLGGK